MAKSIMIQGTMSNVRKERSLAAGLMPCPKTGWIQSCTVSNPKIWHSILLSQKKDWRWEEPR